MVQHQSKHKHGVHSSVGKRWYFSGGDYKSLRNISCTNNDTMTETLYSELHNVRYKSPDTEDRQVSIKITVEIQTTTSPLHRKDLLVRLTDDNDPFFLFNLCLGEEDFQSLKSQQGLLVDFGAFPQKFTGLLQQCRLEQGRDIPKFLLQFETGSSSHFKSNFGASPQGSGQLSVVETNPFKHLTHLSLQFVPGNDADVKKYLASCLKKTMEHRDRLESRLASTERELGQMLDSARSELAQKTKDLDKLRTEATGHTDKLSTRHAQDINNEREKALKIQTEMQKRHDTEKRDMESGYKKTVQQLEKRLSDVENVNKELTDRRYRAEATIREQKAKLVGMDEEVRRCRNDLQQTRRENNALDAERHNQDKNLQQLKTRIAVIEQELLDKERLVSRISNSLENSQETKAQSDQRINDQQNQIRKLEGTVKTMSDELLKGNEIIKRLQGELRGYIGKVKLRNEVTTRQEKLIGEKEQIMDKMKRDLETASEKSRAREEEIEKLKGQLEATVAKLDESRGLLKTNENVINWLNKQLNERQIGAVRTSANVPTSNHYAHGTNDAATTNSFKQMGSSRPPTYSTPLGSTPQALHISGPTITPGMGTSPLMLPPAARPPIQVGAAVDSRIPRFETASAPLQIHYKPGSGAAPGNKENLSPKTKRDASPVDGIDPKYLVSCDAQARNSTGSSDNSNSPGHNKAITSAAPSKISTSLPHGNRISQQALHNATVPRLGINLKPHGYPGQPSSKTTAPKSAYFRSPKTNTQVT